MGKMSTVFALCVLVCALEQCMSMGTYYWTYPDAASAYAYPAPYQPFPAYQPILPADCDQNKVEGSSGESGEAGEPKSEGEEGSTEEAGSSEGGEGTEESSTEVGENKEEVGEIKEGGEENKEEGEQKEGGEPAEGGEKKEGGEEKEEVGKKEGEEKKTDEKKPVFPVTYTFPPRPVQQYIVSVPANYPYRTYSIIQQQSMPYPVKSSGSYYSYSSVPGVPAPSGFSGPVVKSISTAPVARYVTRYMSPVTYSVSPSNGYQSATYWNPTGSNVGYYKY